MGDRRETPRTQVHEEYFRWLGVPVKTPKSPTTQRDWLVRLLMVAPAVILIFGLLHL